MLAAIIKICWYAHLSQPYSFVENKIQHLPNPAVYLHNETPSGPSSPMVLFLLEGKNGNQNYLYLNSMINFYVSSESHTMAYCTLAFVKMGITQRPDQQRPTLIIYMAPLETTEALVGHTQWGHLRTFNLVGCPCSLTPGRMVALLCLYWKGSELREEGKKETSINAGLCIITGPRIKVAEGSSKGGR